MASVDRAQAELRPLTGLRRALIVGVTAAGLAGYSALDTWSRTHLLLINTTTSLPNWAFLVTRGARPSRGSLVFFAAPATPLVRRHFGRVPAPFGKIVYGVGGDVVVRRGADFIVNERVVGRAKRYSMRGERLAPGPAGVLPPGCLFVATPNRDSFDSRYAAIGWICRDRVLGVGEAIL